MEIKIKIPHKPPTSEDNVSSMLNDPFNELITNVSIIEIILLINTSNSVAIYLDFTTFILPLGSAIA